MGMGGVRPVVGLAQMGKSGKSGGPRGRKARSSLAGTFDEWCERDRLRDLAEEDRRSAQAAGATEWGPAVSQAEWDPAAPCPLALLGD